MRDVVKFNGKPVEVELTYSTGKEDNKGNGAFYTYTLARNRIMFANAALNEKIQQLLPTGGDRLSICLLPDNQWNVTRVDPHVIGPGIGAPASPQTGSSNAHHSEGN